jgi:Ca2+-binding RTX toxin-like protein
MSIKTIFTAFAWFAVATGSSVAHAANGNIDREEGVVYITGDQWRDDCRVFVDGNDIVIELTVYDANGEEDDFDDKDYDLDEVTKIVFQGFGGDDDFWNNTSIPCVAYGDGGDDVLIGGWGDDDLYGGAGQDYIAGRSGHDDLFGGANADWVYGGSGNDYLKAGTGEDEWVIAGQPNSDTFATPATFNFWTRTFVEVQRNVYYQDFNPEQDTKTLFWVPLVVTPLMPVFP